MRHSIPRYATQEQLQSLTRLAEICDYEERELLTGAKEQGIIPNHIDSFGELEVEHARDLIHWLSAPRGAGA